MTEWISIENRFPDYYEDVLLFIEENSVGAKFKMVGYYDGEFNIINIREVGDDFERYVNCIPGELKVTHWAKIEEPSC